jgi:hypothetical protein
MERRRLLRGAFALGFALMMLGNVLSVSLFLAGLPWAIVSAVIICVCLIYLALLLSPFLSSTLRREMDTLGRYTGGLLVWSMLLIPLGSGIFIGSVQSNRAFRKKGSEFAHVALRPEMTLGEVEALLGQKADQDVYKGTNLRPARFWKGLVDLGFYADPGAVDSMSVPIQWKIANEYRGFFDGIRSGDPVEKAAGFSPLVGNDGQYSKLNGVWRISFRKSAAGTIQDIEAWDTRYKWTVIH